MIARDSDIGNAPALALACVRCRCHEMKCFGREVMLADNMAAVQGGQARHLASAATPAPMTGRAI